jgi:hypothetical protein
MAIEKNIEALRAKLFSKTKANSISTSSYKGLGRMCCIIREVIYQRCRPQEVNKDSIRKVKEQKSSCKGTNPSKETHD